MMKKFSRKSLILLIVSVVLLTATVAGTLAYMNVDSGLHVNRIAVAALRTELVNSGTNGAAALIQVKNAGDSIDAYVRVALLGSWVLDGQVVGNWTAEEADINTEHWMLGEDGLCYYRGMLTPGQVTENLLSREIAAARRESDGAQLKLTVLHQAIQAQGRDSNGKLAVTDAWDWTPPSGTK